MIYILICISSVSITLICIRFVKRILIYREIMQKIKSDAEQMGMRLFILGGKEIRKNQKHFYSDLSTSILMESTRRASSGKIISYRHPSKYKEIFLFKSTPEDAPIIGLKWQELK